MVTTRSARPVFPPAGVFARSEVCAGLRRSAQVSGGQRRSAEVECHPHGFRTRRRADEPTAPRNSPEAARNTDDPGRLSAAQKMDDPGHRLSSDGRDLLRRCYLASL
jgi:hypothetical protein